MSKWLNLNQIKKILAFLGPRIALQFGVGAVISILLFIAEVLFAYTLQLFLVALGVMRVETQVLPRWAPSFFHLENMSSVIVLILSVGVVRGILLWGEKLLQGASLESFKVLMRQRLARWIFNSDSISTAEAVGLFGEKSTWAGYAIYHVQLFTMHTLLCLLLAFNLFLIDARLTLIAAGAAVALFVPLKLLTRKTKANAQALMEVWDQMTRRMLSSIKNLLLMRIYGTWKTEEKETLQNLDRGYRHLINFYSTNGWQFASPQVVGTFVVCGLAYVMHKEQTLAPGLIVSYFYLSFRLLQSVSQLLNGYNTAAIYWPLVEALAKWWADSSFDGIRNTRSLEPETSSTPANTPIAWRLKQVSFSYPLTTTPVIQKMDLEIPPAKTLVITGTSGSGKSTLLNLLLGMSTPSSGEIQVHLDHTAGWQSLSEARGRLLQSVGYVGAESFLTEGTVYENLIYGLREKPAAQEIREALTKADCGFVDELPLKLEHRLTDQGQGLSAGQKQRLGLARALLRKPRALFLDEATANLDLDTEAKLIQTLHRLKSQMTIVAVSHRPALLELADDQLSLQ